VNTSMLEFAQKAGNGNVRLVEVDAITYRDPLLYDLIVAVLSADYIGFKGTAQTVAYNLASDGSAFILFLDPGRYPLEKNQRVKSWVVSGRKVEARIDNFDVAEAKAHFIESGLMLKDHMHIFRLEDGIERTIHCFECAWQ
jgi:hypothetical protein